MDNQNPAVEQIIYGSTPCSAGYSLLAQSGTLKESIVDEVIQYCENYDQQAFSSPVFPYSVSLYESENQTDGKYRILMEIFSGWSDQVGRPSKVMRNLIIDPESWEWIAGYPFLLLQLLPPIRQVIPEKRNQILSLPSIRLLQLDSFLPGSLWYRESRLFFQILRNLSEDEKRFLSSILQDEEPFVAREIAVDSDCSSLCRAIAYAVPKEKRCNLQLDSFSLNDKPPRGLCFRYRTYCVSSVPFPSGVTLDFPIRRKIETVVRSVPQPWNFEVLEQFYKKERFVRFCYCCATVILIFLLLFFILMWFLF